MNINAAEIIPLNDKVTIKLIKTNNTSKFYTPVKEEEICVGQIINSDNDNFYNNDKIIFNQMSATKIKCNDTDIFIIDANKIIGKIN